MHGSTRDSKLWPWTLSCRRVWPHLSAHVGPFGTCHWGRAWPVAKPCQALPRHHPKNDTRALPSAPIIGQLDGGIVPFSPSQTSSPSTGSLAGHTVVAEISVVEAKSSGPTASISRWAHSRAPGTPSLAPRPFAMRLHIPIFLWNWPVEMIVVRKAFQSVGRWLLPRRLVERWCAIECHRESRTAIGKRGMSGIWPNGQTALAT